jgi:hypothetical protein
MRVIDVRVRRDRALSAIGSFVGAAQAAKRNDDARSTRARGEVGRGANPGQCKLIQAPGGCSRTTFPTELTQVQQPVSPMRDNSYASYLFDRNEVAEPLGASGRLLGADSFGMICELLENFLLVTLRALMAHVRSRPLSFLFVSGAEERVLDSGFCRSFPYVFAKGIA